MSVGELIEIRNKRMRKRREWWQPFVEFCVTLCSMEGVWREKGDF